MAAKLAAQALTHKVHTVQKILNPFWLSAKHAKGAKKSKME
jgi:hypothetical protein